VLGMILSFAHTILLKLSLESSKIKYYEPEERKTGSTLRRVL
jgi:hypothetical protein